MTSPQPTVALRAMTPRDLPLLARWLRAPHVAPWYPDADDWLLEAENRDGAFDWIHHFIAELHGQPIGFAQYYACAQSGEPMGGYTALGGAYSIDYLIGEPEHLRKGLAKKIVAALLTLIARHPDAKRVVLWPDEQNAASRALLRACGFTLDEERKVFVMELDGLKAG